MTPQDERLFKALQAERAKYPTPLSPQNLARVLDIPVWTCRDDGWTLMKKSAGDVCTLPNGITISRDIVLHLPTRRWFDVLEDAEGKAKVLWQEHFDGDMSQALEPFDPAVLWPSTPTPIPTPTPTPIPTPSTHDLAGYIAMGHALDQIYQEELGRKLSDNEAIPNWIFHWREHGQDLEWIRARIKESPEWKAKHP